MGDGIICLWCRGWEIYSLLCSKEIAPMIPPSKNNGKREQLIKSLTEKICKTKDWLCCDVKISKPDEGCGRFCIICGGHADNLFRQYFSLEDVLIALHEYYRLTIIKQREYFTIYIPPFGGKSGGYLEWTLGKPLQEQPIETLIFLDTVL